MEMLSFFTHGFLTCFWVSHFLVKVLQFFLEGDKTFEYYFNLEQFMSKVDADNSELVASRV